MKGNLPFILLWFLGTAISCNVMKPDITEFPGEKIATGPGPEDMVLDTLQGDPRLIISCSARRENGGSFGEIMSLNLYSGELTRLIRHGEPDSLVFRPHGIYLDGEQLLVISHEKEPDVHPILVYALRGDSLLFAERILTPSQHSPNALVSGDNGAIYFVNDSGKRGSILEKALRLRRASLVRLTESRNGNWESEVIASRLGYPAGINRIGDKLYVGDAVLHRIHVFSIHGGKVSLENKIKGLRGADNIRIHAGRLILPGHVKPFRFIRHTGDPEKLSPVAVFSVDPISGSYKTLYYTDGSSISAGSTAVIFGDDLYISQVFEPYILKVKLP